MSKRKPQPDAFGAITNPGGRQIEVSAPHIEWVTWAQNALYSHDDMLAALRAVLDDVGGSLGAFSRDKVLAALAKAEAKS